MELSPFSVSHEWSLKWHRLPSNFKRLKYFNGESPIEIRALKALASVGVISKKQLMSIYGIKEQRLKRMIGEHKLVKHELKLPSLIIPIYTLGENGAIMAGVEEIYQSNYWVKFRAEDVLKCVSFFQLVALFEKLTDQEVEVRATTKPFTGVIHMGGKNQLHVYVLRGDTNDLATYIKWNEDYFDRRLIVVTESLNHLKPILADLSDWKVRYILDEDVFNGTGNLQELFYYLKDGKIYRDK